MRITYSPSELEQRADEYEEALCAEAEARVAAILGRAFARADRALARSLVTPGQRRRRPHPEVSAAINEARRSLRERWSDYLEQDNHRAKVARARAQRRSRPVPGISEPVVTPITCKGPPPAISQERKVVLINRSQ